VLPDVGLIYKVLGGFLALISSGFGNPVPEELLLIGSGVVAGDVRSPWALLMWPAVLVGVIAADVMLYGVGRLLGKSRLLQRLSPPHKRERIRHNFHRYGFWIFAFGRLVPGIRTTLFLSAGMMKIDFKRFLLADGVGALVGCSLFFFLGYGLGAQFEAWFKRVEDQIWPYKTVLLIAVAAVVVAYLLYRYLRNPVPTGDPAEVPIIGPKIAAVLPAPTEEELAEAEGEPEEPPPPAPPVKAEPAALEKTPGRTG
jgi:membrane protein DedA with SNARE-associated domain